MKPVSGNSDELLSAAYDGELLPGERAEADALLEASPAACEVLDDYRELSRLLHALPRARVSPGFTADVLRRVEQVGRPTVSNPRVLGSAGATAANAAGSTSVVDRPPLSKRHSAMLRAFALTVATSILVMLYFGGQHVEHGSRLARAPEMGDDSRFRDGTADSHTLASPASAPASAMTLSHAAPSESFDARSLNFSLGNQRDRFTGEAEQAQKEILAYLDHVGEETILIELDVADIARSANEVHLLLQMRGVQIPAENRPPAAPVVDAASDLADAQPRQIVAFYVESNDAELAEMFDDLITSVDVADLATSNTIVAQPPLAERLVQFETEYRRQNTPVEEQQSRSGPTEQPSTQDRLRLLQTRTAVSRARSLTNRMMTERQFRQPAPSAAPQQKSGTFSAQSANVGTSPPSLARETRGETSEESRAASGEAIRLALPDTVYQNLKEWGTHHQAHGDSPSSSQLRSEPSQTSTGSRRMIAPSPTSRSESAPAATPRRVLFVLQSSSEPQTTDR